ncbi:hypothetical protein OUZ56_009928 [Daphnia magna]|uniref:Uncharacterized protein n=1 Tax=Daphnia magna TaxID=35525 RepID=A0ABR0AHI0_9CRUS|nr:hypothetical protein OUZ56_009928 [Daphnia magna]
MAERKFWIKSRMLRIGPDVEQIINKELTNLMLKCRQTPVGSSPQITAHPVPGQEAELSAKVEIPNSQLQGWSPIVGALYEPKY